MIDWSNTFLIDILTDRLSNIHVHCLSVIFRVFYCFVHNKRIKDISSIRVHADGLYFQTWVIQKIFFFLCFVSLLVHGWKKKLPCSFLTNVLLMSCSYLDYILLVSYIRLHYSFLISWLCLELRLASVSDDC